MKIKAFKGLRPTPDKAAAIASLPYDVVNFEQASAQAEGKPLSFMRVVRSEIELPEGTEAYSQTVYNHAKENFQKLVDGGHLVREDAPCMYLYRQVMGGHAQTGLVATFSAQDYDSDVIKKHEKTREAKENDRYMLTRTLRVNTGPVFLTVKDGTLLDKIVEDKKDADALFDFMADDGAYAIPYGKFPTPRFWKKFPRLLPISPARTWPTDTTEARATRVAPVSLRRRIRTIRATKTTTGFCRLFSPRDS